MVDDLNITAVGYVARPASSTNKSSHEQVLQSIRTALILHKARRPLQLLLSGMAAQAGRFAQYVSSL